MHRVMIVEDDTMVQEVFREILTLAGFEVIIYSDGQSGLRGAARDKADIILLDMNLPDISGMEICRSLKADPQTKHIPVLILTGEAREVASRVGGLDVGAEDYLFKPISPNVLVSRIRSILKVATKPV